MVPFRQFIHLLQLLSHFVFTLSGLLGEIKHVARKQTTESHHQEDMACSNKAKRVVGGLSVEGGLRLRVRVMYVIK